MFDATTWDLPYPVIVLTLFVIVMLRANGTYWCGWWLAKKAGQTKARAIFESKHYQRGAAWINRWGAPAISLSFLTIGIQTMVNLAAGATKMPLTRYLPAVTVGCVIWAFLYGTVGFVGFLAVQMLWDHTPYLVVSLGVLLLGDVIWSLSKREPRVALAD